MKAAAAPVEASDRTVLGAKLALIGMVAIWAANFSIAKDALSLVSPLAFNALRFPMAAAVVFIALRRRGPIPWPAAADRLRVFLFGLLGNVVYQLLFIFGLAHARAGTASILLAGTPIITALLSAAAGHERITHRTWIGTSATLAGVSLVIWSGGELRAEQTGHRLLGELLMLAATVAWASYTVGTRTLVHRYGSLPVTAWMLWVGTLFVVLIGVPDLTRTDLTELPPRAWFAIAYAGALSIGIAYLIWHHGVRRIGNTRTALSANLVPVFALAFAWLWLDEVPLPGQVAGAAIIIGGVMLAQRG